MLPALVTTEPNEERSIEVWDLSVIQGWYLLGIWQWLAWNRLKFFTNLLARFEARERKLTERRRDRESQRSYLKHCGYSNVFRLWAALALWTSEHSQHSIIEYARRRYSHTPLRELLKPLPCFLKGLQGFARTDVMTAPAIN